MDNPFIPSICNNPDDNLPKLIYADWLDENGRDFESKTIRKYVDNGRGNKLLINAFITGSRAYGTPHSRSDIDLVVCVSEEDLKLIETQANSRVIRYGMLNLIPLTPKEYIAWESANAELIAMKPVTRDKAIEVIDKHFIENGLPKRTGGEDSLPIEVFEETPITDDLYYNTPATSL